MGIAPVRHFYSKEAVEAWFRYLIRDWEVYFSPEHLKVGREIYLSDGIREIELTVSDAIVHTKTADKAYYSVITWENHVPMVRSSTRKVDRGRAIAVAGIYQIEELISDKLGDLSAEEPVEAILSPGLEGDETEDREAEGLSSQRPMMLIFSGSQEGLCFTPYWVGADGSRETALDLSGNPSRKLSEAESEALIRLTTMAGRAGFVLDKKTRRFALGDIGRFVPFLSHVLPKWKPYFTILREPEVKRLMQGIQDVKMEALVSEQEEIVEEDQTARRRYTIDWRFQAGGSSLTAEEAAMLTRKPGQPVFLPQKGIVQLTGGQIGLINRWTEFREQANKGQVERYMVLSLFGEGDPQLKLSRKLVQWRKHLFSEPKALVRKPKFLRSYQKRGIEWMLHLLNIGCHCLLADEMGLGKTVQILGVLQALNAKSSKPMAVFCPASVLPVWRSEISRFYPSLTHTQVSGARSMADLEKQSADIVLCSYTQLRRNADAFAKTRFSCVVLDEAQVIKNPDTKVSRAAYALDAEMRIAMSGTPIENHYKDIWSIFYFLMPGLLGSRSRFEAEVEAAGGAMKQKLRNQIAPFILRRIKQEVIAELPAKNEMQLNCSLTEVQRREYNRLVQEGLRRFNANEMGDTFHQRSFNVLALLTRLRQVCCDPGLLPWMDSDPMKSGKIQIMVEKLADIFDAGHKVVIFSQFVGLIQRLRTVIDQAFPSVSVFALTGKTIDREKPVMGFQNAPSPAVMLVSLRAGGTGITLNTADYVFLMDPWWNPSVENQAIDRVHRLGQKNPVFVYRVISTGTIEERVQVLQHEKREMFRHLIEDLKDVSHHQEHINTLKDLLALQ